VSNISEEENQRIAAEFAAFQQEHENFIFTQRNINLLGEQLEEDAAATPAGQIFEINRHTIAIAVDNLVRKGRIELAALPSAQAEETVVSTPAPEPEESYDPRDAAKAQKYSEYWRKRREESERAQREKAVKTAASFFSKEQSSAEEKTERIPDSLLEADEQEQLRVIQLYSGPAVRNFLERKRMRSGS